MNNENLNELIELANNGDNNAQLKYGIMLYEGRSIKKDMLVACQYFNKSAEQNNPIAMFYLGLSYENGTGVKKDIEKAKQYYIKSSELGNTDSLVNLGVLAYKEDTEESYKIAYNNFEKAISQNNVKAYYNCGLLYEEGKGVEKDLVKAREYYKKGSENKDIKSKLRYAYCLREGIGGEKDLNNSLLQYISCATSGNPEGLYYLGTMMVNGEGCEIDIDGGWENIKKAADEKNFQAMRDYGNYLCKLGRDTVPTGLKYLKDTTDSGEARDYYNYGASLIYYGYGNDSQNEEAVTFLMKAVELKSVEAMYELGLFFIHNSSYSRIKEGKELLKTASDLGNGDASLEYGLLFYNGEVEKQDFELARMYFTRAADKDIDQAQFNLALLYYRGEGGKKDLEKARYYFELSCKNDNPEAYYCLGNMYNKGEGGVLDKEKAVYLWSKGEELGDSQCKYAIAEFYEKDPVFSNEELSRECYKKMCDTLNPRACYKYGKMLYSGIGGEVDLQGARKSFEMAHKGGYLKGTYYYAYMLEQGEGGPKDEEFARQYYKFAAERGDVKSMVSYATMILEGRGGYKNTVEALEYYEKAGEKGDGHALFLAGNIYSEVSTTSNATTECYEKACLLGHPGAKYNYALILLKSKEISVLVRARTLLKESAEASFPDAYFAYAAVLEEGIGGNPDIELAKEYYIKAVEYGNSQAKYQLGLIYKEGRIGEVDLVRARNLFQEAADEGVDDAILIYSKMLENGEGGPKNKIEAQRYRRMVEIDEESDEEEKWCLIM